MLLTFNQILFFFRFCLLQINIDEDDISDRFKRLFGQLAGHVSKAKGPMQYLLSSNCP